jgi:hypothetical protein
MVVGEDQVEQDQTCKRHVLGKNPGSESAATWNFSIDKQNGR